MIQFNNRLSGVLVFSIAISLFIYWGWYKFPLPTDEEMIQYFNEHRTEFEQLVQTYRNYRPPNPPLDYGIGIYENQPKEIKALMEKTGVDRIIGGGEPPIGWLPEPYSEHTLQVLRSLYTRENFASKEEIMTTYKKEFPSLFNSDSPPRNTQELARLVSGFEIEMADKNKYDKFRLNAGMIRKVYFYFPQIPRIENNRLLMPTYEPETPYISKYGGRVLESLNQYPPNWRSWECVSKRIEPQWFLGLCKAR
jgi:hypothetical protein